MYVREVVGAWDALPRRVATLHGQSPLGNNYRGSVAHHRTCLAALTDTWLAPSFTSQAPPQGSGPGWLLSSPAHDKKASHRVSVVVVVEWLYYCKRIILVRWADLSDSFFR